MFSEDLLRHPILNHDQEIALARRISAGDADALDELVRHNLRLVYQIARRFYTTDPGTTFDDLLQEGMMGLLKAARKYDPDRGTRFSTYATYWIRQGVQRCALTAGTIRRSANPSHQQVRRAAIRAHALRQSPIVRLDAPVRDRRGEEGDDTLTDLLADASVSVEDQVLSSIEAERIIAILNLTPRGEATVRDWLAGFTREEAGKRHGLSRSWIDTRLRVSNAYHFKEKIMPRTASETCSVPGCDQPRHVSKNGNVLTRCHEHQKQFWRESARARDASMRQPPPHDPPAPPPRPEGEGRGEGFTVGTRHVVSTPDTPPAPVGALREAPSASPRQPSSPPRPEGEAKSLRSEPANECGEAGGGVNCPDCIYREIVALLAARNPRIAELVEVMQTARRLRDDLGI